MLQSIHIALDVHDGLLGKILSEEFLHQPNISIGKAAAPGNGVEPNIFFLDDAPGDVLGRLQTVRRDFPKASLFVLSSDASPDQIVEVMKAGANEYFLKPINPQKIREAVDRVQTQLLEEGKSTGGKAYAFIGSKGGLGTTVLAVNTAVALAGQKSGKIALLDLNLTAGDSSVLVDTVPKTTIADVIRNYHRLDPAFLAGVMEKTSSGFDLLAAPPAPEEGIAITAEQIGRILQHARNLYEMVIIDCPAMSVEARILENLRGMDAIFLNTDLSVPAVRNASRLLKILRKSDIGPTEVVVNRFIRGQTATLEEVEKTLDQRAFWLFPNDFENAMASVNRGTPLTNYNPRSALYRNILEFIQKFQKPAAFPLYRGVKGLLGKAV